MSSGPLFVLPLNVILKNNVALSYFIEYMSSIGAQAYLFFYLNVEGNFLPRSEHVLTEHSVVSRNASLLAVNRHKRFWDRISLL